MQVATKKGLEAIKNNDRNKALDFFKMAHGAIQEALDAYNRVVHEADGQCLPRLEAIRRLQPGVESK